MLTSTDVYTHIKIVSSKTVNSQIRIRLSDVLAAFPISKEEVLVLLVELENRRLIDIHRGSVPSVSLTKYGSLRDNQVEGLNSYEP